MKKTLCLILALVMVFALFACSKKEEAAKPDEGNKPAASSSTGTGTTVKPGGTQTTTVPEGVTSGNQEAATREEIATSKYYPSDTATLNLAYQAEQVSLTATGFGVASNAEVAKLFYESIVAFDQINNEYVPYLAESWEWMDDLTLRIHLRKDVTSHMGDPMTANDVMFSFRWNAETAKMASYYSFIDIDKCKVVDDYTFDLVTTEPYPYLISSLSGAGYNIVVEKTLNAIGGKEAAAENPAAGTGAYELLDWDKTQQIVKAVRRDNYWGTVPYYKYINMYAVDDSTTRLMGIESGDYDFAYNPSRSQVVAAQDNPKLKPWMLLSQGSINSLVFNTNREPLNVLEARQALALAIDYDAILKVAAAGMGQTTDSPICSSFNEAYCPPSDPAKNFMKYDPELAKEKLKEAGYPDGFTINCKYRPNDTMTTATAEILQNKYKEIGVTLELKSLESASWMTDVRAGDFDINLSVGGQTNPTRQLTTIDPRISQNENTGGSGSGWVSAEDMDKVCALIDACKFTVNDAERTAKWQEMQDYCRIHVPMLVLTSCYNVFVTSPKVVGFQTTSGGAMVYTSCYEQEYLDGPAK